MEDPASSFLSDLGSEFERGDRHRPRRARHDDDRPPRYRSRSPRDRGFHDDRRRYDEDDRRRHDRRPRDDPRDWDLDRERRGGRGGGGKRGDGYGSPGRRSPTPEGTIPISKRVRKFTAWDVKAPGFENYTAEQAKMTGMFNLPGQTRPTHIIPAPGTINPFGIQQLPPIHIKGTQGATGPVALNTSYARQSRRLYVGNITLEANERNIMEFFNAKMKELGMAKSNAGDLQSPEPVVAVQVNHDKNYAFVEFRNADEASAAMSLDGIVFQGIALKIRRPKDYLGSEFTGNVHVPGVVSTNVPDTANKIFIGGLPSYLNDEQVMELLTSFGELKAFNLVKEGGSGASKGFAFCEFVDPSITDIACQGLNGMELGDRYLVVQRASIGANPLKRGGLEGMTSESLPPSLAKVAPSILNAGGGDAGQPTRVLQMLNMIAPEELLDDEEYVDIVQDIKDECSNFGQVADLRIPRPIKTEKGKIDSKASESVMGLGKVYVMFDQIDSALAALKAIAGRQFGGRLVVVAFATEETMLTLPDNS